MKGLNFVIWPSEKQPNAKHHCVNYFVIFLRAFKYKNLV